MIPFPGPNSFSWEGDKETSPFQNGGGNNGQGRDSQPQLCVCV